MGKKNSKSHKDDRPLMVLDKKIRMTRARNLNDNQLANGSETREEQLLQVSCSGSTNSLNQFTTPLQW